MKNLKNPSNPRLSRPPQESGPYNAGARSSGPHGAHPRAITPHGGVPYVTPPGGVPYAHATPPSRIPYSTPPSGVPYSTPPNGVPRVTPHSGVHSVPPPPPSLHQFAEPTPQQRMKRAKAIARRALGRWKLAMLVLVLGCAATAALAMNVKRTYRSEARVLFKPGTKVGAGPRGDEESAAVRAGAMAQKANDLIRTSARLEAIIREHDLYPKTVESKGMHEAVEEMRPRIGFREAKAGGQVFIITYEGDHPAVTQKVTQRLAELMVEELSKGSLSEAKRNLEVAENEERKAAEEVDRASTAFATFLQLHPEFKDIENRRQNGGASSVVAVPTTTPKGAASAQDPVLASLHAQRASIQAEIRAATGQGSAAADAAAQEAKMQAARDALEQAQRATAAARADLAAKKAQYTDDFPDVKIAKDNLANAERAERDARQRLADASGPRGPAPAAPPELRKRLDAVNARIAARTSELQKKPGGAAPAQPGAMRGVAEAAEYERLSRTVRLSRESYADRKSDLDKARLAASVASASACDTLSVLDPAFLPVTPAKGDPMKTGAMGGVAALLFAIFVALTRVLLSDTVIDEGDVEALKLVPVLGVVPKLPKAQPKKAAPARPSHVRAA